MPAPFRLNAWVFGSVKFEILGSIAGYNRDEAIGRWARAGSECTLRQSYVLSEAIVCGFFGPRGVEALLSAELGERVEGGVSMLEMDGEIEWYAGGLAGTSGVQRQRRAAGQARAATAQRDARGRLMPKSAPAESPATPAPLASLDTSDTPAKPAESSVSISSSSSISKISPPVIARAWDGKRESYDPDRPGDRGQLALRVWKAISDARVQVHAEYKLEARPFPGIGPSSHPLGFRDLTERIREEGKEAPEVCDHVVEALIAQAREDRENVEWLSEKAFGEKVWRRAKESIPGWRRVPRATQKSSSVFDALDELKSEIAAKGVAS